MDPCKFDGRCTKRDCPYTHSKTSTAPKVAPKVSKSYEDHLNDLHKDVVGSFPADFEPSPADTLRYSYPNGKNGEQIFPRFPGQPLWQAIEYYDKLKVKNHEESLKLIENPPSYADLFGDNPKPVTKKPAQLLLEYKLRLGNEISNITSNNHSSCKCCDYIGNLYRFTMFLTTLVNYFIDGDGKDGKQFTITDRNMYALFDLTPYNKIFIDSNDLVSLNRLQLFNLCNALYETIFKFILKEECCKKTYDEVLIPSAIALFKSQAVRDIYMIDGCRVEAEEYLEHILHNLE